MVDHHLQKALELCVCTSSQNDGILLCLTLATRSLGKTKQVLEDIRGLLEIETRDAV